MNRLNKIADEKLKKDDPYMKGFGRNNRKHGMRRGQRKSWRQVCRGKSWSGQEIGTTTNRSPFPKLISPHLIGTVSEQHISPLIAHVDPEKCIGCGMCQDICPEGAIRVENIARVNPRVCVGCGLCVANCPQGALLLGTTAVVHKKIQETV